MLSVCCQEIMQLADKDSTFQKRRSFFAAVVLPTLRPHPCQLMTASFAWHSSRFFGLESSAPVFPGCVPVWEIVPFPVAACVDYCLGLYRKPQRGVFAGCSGVFGAILSLPGSSFPGFPRRVARGVVWLVRAPQMVRPRDWEQHLTVSALLFFSL